MLVIQCLSMTIQSLNSMIVGVHMKTDWQTKPKAIPSTITTIPIDQSSPQVANTSTRLYVAYDSYSFVLEADCLLDFSFICRATILLM